MSNLIDFSYELKHNAFILFVSSVLAVGSWNGPGLAPEEIIEDLSVAAPMGYGQSKLVSECLLAEAAKASFIRSACCRVGIIAGPVESQLGVWNCHEYIPSVRLSMTTLCSRFCFHSLNYSFKMIISSAYLGVLLATFPSRDRVDWLPVDKVSSILIEVLLACSIKKGLEQVPSAKVFHVVNHNVTSWSSHLMPAVAALYSPRSVGVKLVPFDTWLETLKQSADSSTLNVERT